ncbi:S28 family serine protease [Streptomyces sp. NPDC057638]|uniref:S28 family serine protease n=1 Tax=Streptomyces sp. NPDC057638 TaxID=3346190 RepID=UPI0036D1EA0C
MRKTITGLLSLAALTSLVTPALATESDGHAPSTGSAATADIRSRLLAVPGMRLIEERPFPQHRLFVLGYTQPVDHRNPDRGTFEQRLTVLHRDTSRPTIFHTSGYGLFEPALRSEPARIVDGNQISLEHRFWGPSRPDPADPDVLTIRQAAADQHRVFTALRTVYDRKWISTGNSKGGMTATYYERFYPSDMDAVVAYVAPNDVDDREDSAYTRFFQTVGTAQCRDRLKEIQRQALARRGALLELLTADAAARGATFRQVGGADRALEAGIQEAPWVYWTESNRQACETLPDPKPLSDQALYDTVNAIASPLEFSDQGLVDGYAYQYQAGTELGSPTVEQPHLAGLLRYAPLTPRDLAPREYPMTFRAGAMKDIDRFVRNSARRMLFVNGANDPWGAEPFRLGPGARDSYVLTAPGGDHLTHIEHLSPADRALATATVLRWAGVAPDAVRKDPSKAAPLGRFDARLDRREAGTATDAGALGGPNRPAGAPGRG